MLPWDGSQINLNELFIEEGTFEKTVYWLLRKEDNVEYCIVRTCLNILPCLIDELKPIFKIEKNGTHWGKLGSKIMILLKVKVVNDVIIEDLSLDQIGYKSQISHEIQKIFVFREMLGLSRSWEKSIVLRQIGHFIKPISFYEPNMTPAGTSKIIPDKVLEKWFEGLTINDVIKKMFDISKIEDITKLLYELREKMLDVFNRVDKEAITNLDQILSRIGSRLQFIL